jgi:hypothetical protein
MSFVIWALAAIGYVVTAFKVLPHLWDTDVLSCICVAAALALMVVSCINNAFKGERLL